MLDNLTKQNIKKAINKLFSLQFEDMKEDQNYIELVRISKNVEGIPSKNWLILNLLELLFIEKSKLKDNCRNEEIFKFFDYLLDRKKNANSDFQKQFFIFVEYEKYLKIFQNAKFITPKEIQIIAFIATIINNFKILFNCLDSLYSMKIPNYISCQEEPEFPDTIEIYLEQLELFLKYNDFENSKEYLSLCYNEKEEFHFVHYSYEEIKTLINKFKQEKTFKDIKTFIANNSIKISNSQNISNNNKVEKFNSEIKENKVSIKDESKKNNDLKEKAETTNITNEKEDINQNISSYSLNEEQKKLLEYIKIEINKDYYKKINEQKKDYDEKLNEQTKNYEEKLNEQKKNYEEKIDNLEAEIKIVKEENIEMKIDYDNKIRRLKKMHECEINNINNKNSKFKKSIEYSQEREKEKYNNLRNKYDSSKLTNKNLEKSIEENKNEIQSLSDEKNKLSEELNTIRSRVLSKGIIDFLSYIFTVSFDKSYMDKKVGIILEINKKKKDYQISEEMISQLTKFVEKIYNLKIEGDDYAHLPVELNCLFNLIGDGFEKVKDLLQKLDLSSLLNKYNDLYKQKSRDNDYSKIKKEIDSLLPSMKNTFILLIPKL